MQKLNGVIMCKNKKFKQDLKSPNTTGKVSKAQLKITHHTKYHNLIKKSMNGCQYQDESGDGLLDKDFKADIIKVLQQSIMNSSATKISIS